MLKTSEGAVRGRELKALPSTGPDMTKPKREKTGCRWLKSLQRKLSKLQQDKAVETEIAKAKRKIREHKINCCACNR